jgi:hypothetical protein
MADAKISELPSATPVAGDQFPFVRAGVTSRAPVFENGSFAFTLTGFGTPPSGTMFYTKIGPVVTWYLKDSVSATSNATEMNIAAGTIPSAIRPAQARNIAIPLFNSGIVRYGGAVIFNEGSVIFVLSDLTTGEVSGSLFDNTGTKGVVGSMSLTYNIGEA